MLAGKKENKEIDHKKNKKIQKLEKPKNVLENKKNTNLEKEKKDFNVIKNSTNIKSAFSFFKKINKIKNSSIS